MAALYKILRFFAVVLANLFCDGVYHKSLLQQHIPNDFLVANQVNDGVPSHVGTMPAFDIHGGKSIFQFIPPVTFQIEVGGQPYDLGLLRYDFQPPVDLPVTIHGDAPRQALLIVGFDTPLLVFRYRAGLLLCISSEEGKQKLAILAHGVDILFFKENVHPHEPKLPDGAKRCHSIAGKTGNRLCNYHVDFSGPAIGQKPLKFATAVFRAGQRLVGIHTCVLPAGRFLDHAAVLADLRGEGMKRSFSAAGYPRIGRHAL